MESRKLDENFDYSTVGSLRREAVQKLNLYKPANIGQASRIAGVSPADISVLLVHLEQSRHAGHGEEKKELPIETGGFRVTVHGQALLEPKVP